MENKVCLECGEPLKGRSDKKFCDDQCRNSYNNRQNSNSNNLIRRVNNTLRKNRTILMNLNPSGKTKVKKSQLTKNNFDFDYFTHIYNTRKGTTYYYCYDYGYLKLEEDYYIIVKDAKSEDV